MNFTWAFSSSFTRVEWGLAATPYAFDTPPGLLVSFFLKATHYQLKRQQHIQEECQAGKAEVKLSLLLEILASLMEGCMAAWLPIQQIQMTNQALIMSLLKWKVRTSWVMLGVTRTRLFRIKIPLGFKAENWATIFHIITIMNDCFWQMSFY